jgi:D-alanine-D-alanine ligase
MVLGALCSRGVDAHPFDPRDRGLDALIAERFDRVFIALHGRYGEDGTIQGALELLGIPYTGAGVRASALAMDKWRTKLVWEAAGIPTPEYELLDAHTDFAAVANRLGLPIMVKPVNEGSSIGMTKVRKGSGLGDAYALAAKYDALVMAERFIDGIELTVGIVGGAALPAIRLETPRDFYDYEAKYITDDTRYILPCGITEAAEQNIARDSLRAFDTLGCHGWGRVDLMLDRAGKHYFLEVNTSPGMTDHSLVPMAARHAGIAFDELCVRILALASIGGSPAGRSHVE